MLRHNVLEAKTNEVIVEVHPNEGKHQAELHQLARGQPLHEVAQ